MGDSVSWDSPRLHAHDPVIDGEHSLLLLKELLEVLLLGLVSCQPSFSLDLDDVSEGFVFFELSVNPF